jgi:hypothetical protein
MADEAAAGQALAGLAVSASLIEALLKRGIIDQADADTIIRDAASYVAAFSTDCEPAVEREAQRLLTLIGKAEQKVAVTEAPPVPVVEPATS